MEYSFLKFRDEYGEPRNGDFVPKGSNGIQNDGRRRPVEWTPAIANPIESDNKRLDKLTINRIRNLPPGKSIQLYSQFGKTCSEQFLQMKANRDEKPIFLQISFRLPHPDKEIVGKIDNVLIALIKESQRTWYEVSALLVYPSWQVTLEYVPLRNS